MKIPAQLTLANFVTNVSFNRGSVKNDRICSHSSFLPGISEFTNSDPVYNFSQVNGQLVVQREGVYHVFAQVFLKIIQTLRQSTITEWSLLSMKKP